MSERCNLWRSSEIQLHIAAGRYRAFLKNELIITNLKYHLIYTTVRTIVACTSSIIRPRMRTLQVILSCLHKVSHPRFLPQVSQVVDKSRECRIKCGFSCLPTSFKMEGGKLLLTKRVVRAYSKIWNVACHSRATFASIMRELLRFAVKTSPSNFWILLRLAAQFSPQSN